MRMRSILPADCARACQQVSMRLDSELSELETAQLETHLAACSDCRAFGQAIASVTHAIRRAPTEYSTVSIGLPRRRSRVDALLAGSMRAGSAVAAMAVVAVAGLMVLDRPPSSVAGADLRTTRALLDLHERDLQQLDQAALPASAAAARGVVAARSAQLTSTSLTNDNGRQGRR